MTHADRIERRRVLDRIAADRTDCDHGSGVLVGLIAAGVSGSLMGGLIAIVVLWLAGRLA